MSLATVHRPDAVPSSLARGVTRAACTLLGLAGALGIVVQVAPIATAHASAGLYYQQGYYLDNGWLCYGWSNGAYHCTIHWHRTSSGQLVSDNAAWVPNYSAAWVPSYGVVADPAPQSSASAPLSFAAGAAPTGISQWAYTGHPSYAMGDSGGDPYYSAFGYCTWYVWYRNRYQPLMQMGNAWQWAFTASAYGLRTGSSPAVGATAVFQPGVQGASSLGHAAHVEAVYSNGWFLVSEMSFYWNGGGWGRVDYRYAHTGPGVSFIYA